MKVLFIGDVFGEPGIKGLEKHLKKIKTQNKIDFTIVQGENVSGRKGLIKKDFNRLVAAGVDAFTMGNHIWAKDEINDFIDSPKIIRPYNIDSRYPGKGTRVFKVKGQTLRVTSMLGISFNELHSGWKQKAADPFFDAFDEIHEQDEAMYHLIDFHAETTAEKKVFGLYVDGKVTAFVGTHTHVQTSDEHILPKGTAYITDVGMTGPIDCAIGASFESVYKKMRYNTRNKFKVSENRVELNSVIISFNKNGNTIKRLNKSLA